MIGHFVSEDDENWLNFLLLLQIVDLLSSPQITVDEAVYLQLLIEHHHQEFSGLYPEKSITPKMHYMVHIPILK